MKDNIELKNQIEKTRKDTEREYAKVLKTVRMLKKKMNELEQNIRKEDQVVRTSDSTCLGLAIKSLNDLTDSQILRSKKAWKEHRKLETYCKQFALQPVELDNLKFVCKKMEELAADLLCYSLGRFELTDQ